MTLCYHCADGRTTTDEPSCYRPDQECKWVPEEMCEPLEIGDRCLCEAEIVACKVCEGRGVILSPLEKLAETAR